jgi:hypothetical protein
MPNPDTIALAASAAAQGLEAILVGGNAVNLHTYSRTNPEPLPIGVIAIAITVTC